MRRIKRKVGGIKYLPVLLILLSVTIMVGSTFAYFTDKKEDMSDLTFSKVELSSETTVGIDGKLRDVIPGTKLVDGAVSFSKSIDSEAIYVRAKISFSMPREFALDSDMQAFIKELRNATDFNIISSEQHGAVWSERDGNYFYLVSSIDNTKLMRVDTIDTFTLSNEVVVPRDLKNLPDNAQYMKSINFHIAFEAIQADNVSDVLSETKITFDTLFPTPAVEKAGIYVSIMNNDLMSVKEEYMLIQAGTIEAPEAEDIVVDGTTSHIFDGWYVNAELTEKFDFTKKVTASVSLYPKYLVVSQGLEYSEIYETATTGEGPAAVGDVIGYSVAQGSCTDSEIILPLEYNGKPILEIASDGFKNNSNLTNIKLNDTITKINGAAFYNCSNLALTTLPSDLISIETYAFNGCTALALTSLPQGLKSIANHVFYGCSNIVIEELPDGLTTIGNDAFHGCKLMTISSLPSGLTSIEHDAFNECEKITIDKLPNGVTSIGYFAFRNCKNIKQFTLTNNITNIGTNAFIGCVNLNYLLCESEAVGLHAQDKGVNNSKVYVKQLQMPNACEFTAVEGLDIATGTDSDGKLWLRVGASDYSYYKQFVTYNVTFKDVDLSSDYKIEKVIAGELVVEPTTPVSPNTNTQFDGWYIDKDCTTKFDFTTPITSTMTLYPKFNSGNTLTLMNVDKTTTFEKRFYIDNQTVEYFHVDGPKDYNGTTTKVIEGWYLDKACTVPFEFGNVLSEDTTIYPNALNVSSDISYYKIEENGEIIGYGASCAAYPNADFIVAEYCQNYKVIKVSSGIDNLNIENVFLPIYLTTIGDFCFNGCTNLKTIRFDGVTTLNKYAFYNCQNLEINELPSSLTYVGERAFAYCKKLNIDKFPSSLTTVERSGFSYCTGITVTELPSSLINIGAFGFDGCTNLALTELPSGITKISAYAFQNCTSLALTSLPDSIELIETYAFYNCTSLALTSLPEGLHTIESMAFHTATKVAFTSFPESLTSIGSYCFNNCYGLRAVIITSNLSNIGNGAFYTSSVKLEYMLCDTKATADRLRASGVTNKTNVYVMASENSLDYTAQEIDGISLESAITADNVKWVRVNNNGAYTYYQEYIPVYTVDFVVDGEPYDIQQQVSENKYASPLSSPTKEGYRFKGWSVDETNVIMLSTYQITRNITFYAVWEQMYTLTVNYGGAEGYDEPTIMYFDDEQIITRDALPATLTKTKYAFRGWRTTENYSSSATFTTTEGLSESINVYPTWYSLNKNGSFNVPYEWKSGAIMSQSERRNMSINYTLDDDFNVIAASINGTAVAEENISSSLSRTSVYDGTPTNPIPNGWNDVENYVIRISLSIDEQSVNFGIYFSYEFNYTPVLFARSLTDTTGKVLAYTPKVTISRHEGRSGTNY